MFNLTEPLPTELNYHGHTLALDLAFDTVLLWYQILDDDLFSEREKIELAFDNFVDTPGDYSLEDKVAIIEEISTYLSYSAYGNTPTVSQTKQTKNEPTVKNDVARFFSYEKDAEAIFSSFYADYKIDLFEERGKLHFGKFSALLMGLSESTFFKRLLAIRQANPADYEGQALIDLLEAQTYYALDEQQAAQNLDSQMGDIFQALKTQATNGGE